MHIIKCIITGYSIMATIFGTIALFSRIDDKMGIGFCLFWLLITAIAFLLGELFFENIKS